MGRKEVWQSSPLTPSVSPLRGAISLPGLSSVLARRFIRTDPVGIYESDYSILLEIIDHNDQFVPFVLAYAKRTLIEAKEGFEKVDRNNK